MQGICEATGEIDLATALAFETSMRFMIERADVGGVFIDCSAITFMDSSAFHALVSAQRYATDHGQPFVIGNLRPNCARTLNLCDWDTQLTIDPSTGPR